MNKPKPRGLAAALFLAPLILGCATSPRAEPSTAQPPAAQPPAAQPPATPPATPSASTQPATPPAAPAMAGHEHHAGMAMPPITIPAGVIYTKADVEFMQGMIAHHAQAVVMSRLVPTRGSNPRLQRLAQKIDLAQAGEIVLMQDWLRANGQFVPDTSSWRTMTMHGMLTAQELAKLEAARGPAFDRLFLEGMIRHHEGAIRMVKDLFATPRAGQDVDVSVFANDVESTQTAEIGVMRRMLEEM